MSRRRIGKSAKCQTYPIQLREAIGRFLPGKGLPTAAGNAKLRWTARLLAVCAVLTVWSAEPTLGGRFDSARQLLVGMFPSRRRAGATYPGFIAALARASASLLAVIVPHLRKCVRRVAGPSWEVLGWAAFAVDGSKLDVPMTRANEDAFGVAGRKRAGPQMLLTVLFHVGSGLAWAWRRGVAKASERSHLLEMLDTLPINALLLADAGFTGYDLLRAVAGGGGGGRSFLIRVGSNVRLLTKLGYRVREFDGLVWLWPAGARGEGREPMALRLVTVNGGRKGTLYLLTNVLDAGRLSDADAGRLYAMRWGVELLYRSLKQTMGRGKMLSDSPAHAGVELDWSVIGLWVLGLANANANAEASGDPRRLSPAQTLRRVRAAMAGRGGNLWAALADARRDRYQRRGPKTARHWPHKKRERPPGVPKARTATEEEVLLAQRLAELLAAA
jgi:hypothetical protein